MCPRAYALIILVLILFCAPAWAGANFDLVSATGGITLTQVGNNYISSFGTLNALGIGTPAAGVTALPQTNGTLYYTPYSLFVHGGLGNGQTGYVTAYVSTNFGHPLALTVYSCPSSSSCNAFAQYSAMSTNPAAGSQTTVIPPPGIAKGQTVNAGLAIWVPDNNTANAFSGTDSAVITFTMINNNTGATIETLTLSLNNPNETLQSAVRLTLSTGTVAAIHCTVVATGGTPDYTINFGSVDALGINNGNCNKFTPATPGVSNAIYWSDYTLTPAFSDQNPSSGTTITARVTTDFAAPHNIFVVRDSANSSALPGSAAAFTAVSTASADTIVTSAANRTAVTRYIGLAVKPTSGAGILQGSQSATVTFTLTVQ